MIWNATIPPAFDWIGNGYCPSARLISIVAPATGRADAPMPSTTTRLSAQTSGGSFWARAESAGMAPVGRAGAPTGTRLISNASVTIDAVSIRSRPRPRLLTGNDTCGLRLRPWSSPPTDDRSPTSTPLPVRPTISDELRPASGPTMTLTSYPIVQIRTAASSEMAIQMSITCRLKARFRLGPLSPSPGSPPRACPTRPSSPQR